MIDLSKYRITVTGGNGFLGKAVCKTLKSRGNKTYTVPRSEGYDLTTMWGAESMFRVLKPEIVIHLAADVGGIAYNKEHPGQCFYNNMAIGLNVIEQSRIHKIRKLVFVSTVCAYPRLCRVPFTEDQLFDGYPEATNAPYGVAKRALSVMLEGYLQEYGMSSAYLLLANLYGPGDNYESGKAHVIPDLIRRFCDAAESKLGQVTCWGSGRPSREFLYVDDAAEAVVRAAGRIDEPTPINIGTGVETNIYGLAHLITKLCGYHGLIEWDESKPDGQPRRRLDVSRAKSLLGWTASTTLDRGLIQSIADYRSSVKTSG